MLAYQTWWRGCVHLYRYAALEAARTELDALSAGSSSTLEELQAANAGLEAERKLTAQLTDALQRLKAAHEEALSVPAALEAGFDEKLRSLVAAHEEARKMWMEVRRPAAAQPRAPH